MDRLQSRAKFFVPTSAALIVALSCVGCTSLLNPYVRDAKLDAASSTQGVGVDRLANAIEAAEAQRAAYYSAVGDRAKLRNALPMVLLPLSAVTLYRGITTTTDAGRRLVLELGILGAAVYSTSNSYLSAPRERIYLAGTLALSCAIHAVEPYLAAKPDYAAFKRDLPALESATEQVNYLRRELIVLRNQLPAGNGNIAPLAESQTNVAEALAARARTIASTARKLDAQIGNAAGDFRFAVQRITDQVDRQIEATDQDPSAVLRAAGGLAKVGAELANVSALRLNAVGVDLNAKSQSKGDTATARTIRALDELADANNRLMELMSAVASFNSTVLNSIKNASRLDSCTVAEVANELIISPSDDSVALKTGIAQVFRVRGTSGIPDAALVGAIGDSSDATKDAVKILSKTVDGNVLVVRVLQEKAVEGNKQATLEFSANERTSGTRKLVILTLDAGGTAKPVAVKAPAPAAQGGDVGPKNADPASNYETKVLTVDKLKQVQKKLGVSVDGVFGPKTRKAIKDFQGGANPDDHLTPELVDKILIGGATAAPQATLDDDRFGPKNADPASEYETKVLTVGKLKQVQKQLGENPDGAFGPSTRAAIKQFQGGASPDGRLTADLVVRILKVD